MRAHGRLGVVVLVLGLALTAACAVRPSISLTDVFVIRGDGTSPEATFDTGEVADDVREGAPDAPEPAVLIKPIPKVSAGTTLETETPELATVLAKLAVRESVQEHRRAAHLYWQERVFDRADHHLSLAIALRPRDARLFEERARLWRDASVLDRALADAHQAAFLAPGLVEVQNTLGTVLYALGHVERARARFERAVALKPTAVYAQSNLCFAAYVEGALEQALAACDEALRIEPRFRAARINRARVDVALMARRDTQGPDAAERLKDVMP